MTALLAPTLAVLGRKRKAFKLAKSQLKIESSTTPMVVCVFHANHLR